MKLSHIIEAKYHRDITADKVANMYYDAYEDLKPKGIDLATPKAFGMDSTVYVTMYARVHTGDEEQAVSLVKNFLNDNNLPHTSIKADDGEADIPGNWFETEGKWIIVVIEYDTEAR